MTLGSLFSNLRSAGRRGCKFNLTDFIGKNSYCTTGAGWAKPQVMFFKCP